MRVHRRHLALTLLRSVTSNVPRSCWFPELSPCSHDFIIMKSMDAHTEPFFAKTVFFFVVPIGMPRGAALLVLFTAVCLRLRFACTQLSFSRLLFPLAANTSDQSNPISGCIVVN